MKDFTHTGLQFAFVRGSGGWLPNPSRNPQRRNVCHGRSRHFGDGTL